MTNTNITRKGQVGQPGNKGHFASKLQSEGDVSLGVASRVEIPEEFYDVWDGPAEHAAEAHAYARLSALSGWIGNYLTPAIRKFGAEEVLATVAAGDPEGTIAGALNLSKEDAHKRVTQCGSILPHHATMFTQAKQRGIKVRTSAEGGIPSQFSDLGDDAPLALWTRGDATLLDELDTKGISVVGARAATGYGEAIAAEWATDLAARERVIVHGAGFGIDGAAGRAALASGGKTVAFMAGGPDRAYPAGHLDLINRIAANGLVVSENPPGEAPTRFKFQRRGRLIAAATPKVVVVEAGTRSGTLYIAEQANILGRDVFAVPGSVMSAASYGSNALLRDGKAKALLSSDEL